MTDGTSQGLFIVVAIVIFGIFVAISYTLFRDQVSPAFASMFTNATETANERLVNNKYVVFDKSSFTKVTAPKLTKANVSTHTSKNGNLRDFLLN